MPTQRQIDIYSAGCAVCDEMVKAVQSIACASCNITVKDMTDPMVAQDAKGLGINAVPAVVIDGVIADCCAAAGPDIEALKAAGIGRPR